MSKTHLRFNRISRSGHRRIARLVQMIHRDEYQPTRRAAKKLRRALLAEGAVQL